MTVFLIDRHFQYLVILGDETRIVSDKAMDLRTPPFALIEDMHRYHVATKVPLYCGKDEHGNLVHEFTVGDTYHCFYDGIDMSLVTIPFHKTADIRDHYCRLLAQLNKRNDVT